MSANVEAYLHELADPARPLAVSKLVNLSSMPLEQVSLFMNAWLQMDVRRRRRLVQELLDLAEDNVELNFDAVFFIALADTDAEVRRNAVKGLWEYEGRDLIDSLLGLLERDPDAAVRAEAALALGRFVLLAEFETLRSVDAERVGRGLRRTIDNDAEVVEVRARALESRLPRRRKLAQALGLLHFACPLQPLVQEFAGGPAIVDLAEIQHVPVNDPTTGDATFLRDTPVPMLFAVFMAPMTLQVHDESVTASSWC